MTEKFGDPVGLNYERTTFSTILYIIGAVFVFLTSWISVNWRSLPSLGQHSSHEMLTFGGRSHRFAIVPAPTVQSTTETEHGERSC